MRGPLKAQTGLSARGALRGHPRDHATAPPRDGSRSLGWPAFLGVIGIVWRMMFKPT